MTDFKNTTNSFIYSGSALSRLIIVNVLVFLLLRITGALGGLFQSELITFDNASSILALPSNLSQLLHKPWTIITYMFYHWDPMHIIFNMLWLYWLGQILSEFLGGKKLLSLYLLGGISGGILYVAAYNLFPLFADARSTSFALGASAGVLSIVVATATLLPDRQISLLLIGNVALKWIALVAVLLDLININGSNAGGHIAHLGGAIFGFTFIKLLKNGVNAGKWLEPVFEFGSSRTKMRVAYRKGKSDEEYNVQRRTNQEKMDEILDKINKSGYGSLSQSEKEFLHKMSNEK